jgi:hypothetical protein
MRHEIEDRFALLPGMSKPKLIDLWNELFKVPAPRQLRRNLLVRFVAYKQQEKVYGDLSPATRKRLHELAENSQRILMQGFPRPRGCHG